MEKKSGVNASQRPRLQNFTNHQNMHTTDQLRALDRQYLWHPFTHMKQWLADEPLVITAGEGCYLIDSEGHRYLDGVSSLWCNVHGHRVPEIDARDPRPVG